MLLAASRRRSHRGWPGRTCGGSDRSPNRSGRRWAPFVVSGAVASPGRVAVAALRQPARITGRHPRGHESACVYCPWRSLRRPEYSPSATEAPRQGWPSGSALLTWTGVPSSGSWSRYRGAWSRLRGENERPCPDSQRRRGCPRARRACASSRRLSGIPQAPGGKRSCTRGSRSRRPLAVDETSGGPIRVDGHLADRIDRQR